MHMQLEEQIDFFDSTLPVLMCEKKICNDF